VGGVWPTCAALDADGQLTTLQNRCEATNLTQPHFYRNEFALSDSLLFPKAFCEFLVKCS
ncbi:MAG: hypothetical protein J5I90_01120, partial [Caldilineales bacterium]|nr:hypothetical protein [Caldilineales bacterium]